jgi:hypothetical protein
MSAKNKFFSISVSVIALLMCASVNTVQAEVMDQTILTQPAAKGTLAKKTPSPDDPYPVNAAGWGPEVGHGLFLSRWAEDWTGMDGDENVPQLKVIPLGNETTLTLSAEARLRYDAYDNGQLISGNNYQQGLFRGVLGADLRFNPAVRIYTEIASGQVEGHRDIAGANFQNEASLQQLFVDMRETVDSLMVGAMVGRQEFADGPRQLISPSDGPNIHRTWNGVRFYAHGQRFRVDAYNFRVTQLVRGAFDEEINGAERLQGVNSSMVVSSGSGRDTYLDPFWIHSVNPNFRAAGYVGIDERDTLGIRFWGRQGELKFDLTLAHQSGRYLTRDINAWGLFTVHSMALSNASWKPRLMAHIDIASGGTYGAGTVNGFNQLYASSGYLGEGQFLSLSNLLMIAPGISISPTPATNLSVEYGYAQRLNEDDAAYAGGMRAYAGTQKVQGKEIGSLLRIIGTWSVNKYLTLNLNYEQLTAGEVLKRAQLPSGSYSYVGATFRF